MIAFRGYLIAAAIAALIGSHWYAYEKGKDREQDKAAAAALAHREKEQQLIAELEQAKQKREVIYRDKIRIIKEANDACLDSPLPDNIFDLLRSYSSEAERLTDPRLRPTRT